MLVQGFLCFNFEDDILKKSTRKKIIDTAEVIIIMK